jgi:hypothetical protein
MKNCILILLVSVVLFVVIRSFSGFSNINDILSDHYTNKGDTGNYADQQWACKNPDNRVIPSGHLPGSTILLTENEKKELLQRFIDNGPQLI